MDTDATRQHPSAFDPGLEEFAAAMSERLAAPQPAECLPCFTARMLEDVGCNGTLHWAEVWGARRPAAGGLLRRLQSRGGYCDCEVLGNVWRQAEDPLAFDEPAGDPLGAAERPACGGVGARSAESCPVWVPVRRGR